jgi:hypothetical protein
MCEIIRALVAGGVIEGAKIDDLNESIADAIDCPGDGDNGQSEVCAVSGGSAGQSYSWYILLDGISITANEMPKWELDSKSKDKLELRKSTI